jgi:2-keto-4-pentenoate hydratase
MPHLKREINLKTSIVPADGLILTLEDAPLSLAENLAAARKTRSFHLWQADEGPSDHAGAYEVQAQVARLSGETVAGWKTGFAPEGQGRAIAGPLFEGDTRAHGGTYRLAAGQWVIVEVELAIRLARDLPRARVYSVDDILDATDEIVCAIELVGTRYADFEAPPFEAKLADNLNNAGFVAGTGRHDVRDVPRAGMALKLWRDGALVAEHEARHNDGEPLLAVAAFASQQPDHLGGLKAGHYVTTGSLNRLLKVDGPAEFKAELGGIGSASLRIAI